MKILLGSVVLTAIVIAALVFFAQGAQVDLALGNLVIRSQEEILHSFPLFDEPELEDWTGWSNKARNVEVGLGFERQISNLIIMVADGMGLGMLSSTSSLVHGPAGGFVIERAPVTGFARVAVADNLVPDSAGAGTAMATGFKTNKGMVAMLPDGSRVRTLHETARAHGMMTAIVTTSYITDATPACFSAHVEHRNQYPDILAAMIRTGFDLVIGGETGVASLVAEGGDAHAEIIANYNLVRTKDEFATAQLPLFGVFPQRPNADANAHGPRLETSLQRVLDLFEGGDRGFVMLLETEVTDGAGHDNNIERTVNAMGEFDEAVALAVRYAEAQTGTLVLVLGDHDTGGPAVTSGDYASGEASVRWVTDGHTAEWVPVFAFGARAEQFAGVQDMSDIAVKLGNLLGFKDFPAIIDD